MPSIPANVFADPGIKSPTTQELTFDVGRELGQKGFAKATSMCSLIASNVPISDLQTLQT